jgi:tRNA G18 (ribose-2'-O)-methylase SpoU
VAEGRLLLERLIAATYQMHSVLLSPAAMTALGAMLSELECPVYVAARQLLHEITGFNFHRGCLALAKRPTPYALEPHFASRRLLGLEGIGNPDNIGGLFRSAAAFGADGVVLDEASGDPFYRKALRTSMGAILRIPFTRIADWVRTCGEFRDKGFLVAALVVDPRAIAIDAIASGGTHRERVLLLVGSEGAGLSEATQAAADVRVTIPMTHRVDSLNVAVAASVAMSWIWRET